LIVDDIEDSSIVRRDKECVHLIYGIDISVNASNFMYFAPLNYLLKSGKLTASQHIKLAQVYAEEMTALHIGQGWDILWHNLHKLKENYPTEHDYLQMTAHKTGVLARLATRLVCIYLELEDK
jgi:geranylgeranyl pyrophosphate synthase